MNMKIRMKRDVLVEVFKPRFDEVWDKALKRWDELNAEKMDVQGKIANLTTVDKDVYLSVPVDSFEVLS